MSILRREPRKPKPASGPATLDSRLKAGDGSTSRYRVVKVEPYAQDAPGVRVWIQNQGMGASVTLGEDEVGQLVTGLREALRASKAITADRQKQEESPEESR